MDVCANILVEGLVQGVGFRYFVHKQAAKLGLKGIVKNNFDGSVEIDVEGDRSLVEEFIKEVKVGPRVSRVADVKVVWMDFNNRYPTFEIE